ncbi:hypothetical protein SteCoe_38559 [Stentor coeruleus]|uniref:Peptidase A1 domain-containing protein n=1 Tax=Stentor coeruleus TaxID=5963 RepID=A0A1R2AL99_9CILI|nr:hypothetical protein SteCoe_38559 [Stentor coeruleus]
MAILLCLFLGVQGLIEIPLYYNHNPQYWEESSLSKLNSNSKLDSVPENSIRTENARKDSDRYYIYVSMGTHGQKIKLDLDMTTGLNFVYYYYYNEEKSSNFSKSSTLTYLYNYAGSYAYGYISKDVIIINNEIYYNSSFLLASDYTWNVNTYGCLGLGLGLKEYSSFIYDYYLHSQNSSSSFSITLGNQYGTGQSVIYIGDSGDGYLKDEYIWTYASTSKGEWKISISDFTYDSNTYEDYNTAIVDVGTDKILLPDFVFAEFIAILDDLDIVCSIWNIVKCEYVDDFASVFPSINFKVGDYDLSITPEKYIYHNNNYLQVLIDKTSTDYIILGQPLFREYFMTFYVEGNYGYIYFYKLNENNFIASLASYVGSFLSIGIIGAALLRIRRNNQSADYQRII